MSLFIVLSTCLSAMVGGDSPDVTPFSDQSEPMCHDWGEHQVVRVLTGEVGWLSCPLFSHPTVYNYSSAHSSGLNLFWYRLLIGQDLEQPIRYSQQLSKDGERLWFQPATTADSGQYICMLRNRTSCTKISMPLEVVEAGSGRGCVAVVTRDVVVPFQEGKTLRCPDLQDVAKMADGPPSVTWYHNCSRYPFWDHEDREVKGDDLTLLQMLTLYEGQYYCHVRYARRNQTLGFTRMLNVSGVSPSSLSKLPSILLPNKDTVYTFKLEADVHLECWALFPYLEGSPPWDIWWSVDGRRAEQLDDPRFSTSNRLLRYDHGERREESVLVIKDLRREDLSREMNCSARNEEGVATYRASVREEVHLPSVELGCGLGATLVLMLLLFVVYHVFWFELLLLYRSWFGTDERFTDEKEFDVYISYARNADEEQFAVSTLRKVLETDLGYSVCIFDRDSLPGGTITDETLSFVGRSRRLLVVLSPGFAKRGSQALLELKTGIDHMALGGHLRVILVQYKPIRRQGWVRELRRARVVLAVLRWKGEESRELTSHFWKRLRVELPVRRAEWAGGRREESTCKKFQTQNSTSSQTGLLSEPQVNPPQKGYL